ncbi:MAG TPA: glycosyltransferase family 4 protein [Syntrophales bacterium]|nr:glycosyltransferase family 4 protein [Syntrophales bacterium]
MELLIVGYGPEERRLQKLAGSSSHIHFLGHRGIGEIPMIYGISDILVLPSISEPWGLVVNEAMACGCAVIVSDRCGCSKDLIQDNGIIVEGGKPEPLVEALEQLVSSESRLEAMKKRGIKIISRFSIASLVERISFFRG